MLGNETNAPQNRVLDRYQTSDNLNWQKGSHRIRFGAEWEHNYGVGSWDFFDPALIVLHDPRDIEATNAGLFAAAGAVPEPFRTLIRTNLAIPNTGIAADRLKLADLARGHPPALVHRGGGWRWR